MVYGAIARILFPVTAVALVGAAVWGYQEHNEKNSILIKAENSYQRAFHDLTYNIEKLHDELGKSLVVNSRNQVTPTLANVWRLAYEAQQNVGQLPLILMPFNNTEEFLSKVADFAHRVAVRDLSREPLTEKEYKTLKTLYTNSKKIMKQLRHVQTEVLDKHLRWMDVETALASEDKTMDNTIIDGFKLIDKQVQEFDEIDWGVNVQSSNRPERKPLRVSGKTIGKQEAARIAQSFVGIKSGKVSVDDSGKSADYSAYSVSIQSKGNPIRMDVTKKGGKVVWLLNERDIKEERLTLKQAEAKARKFLESHGYKNMVPVENDSYQGLAVFTFVHQQNGVRIYPDAVTVKVALDNGDVNGFHAEEYLKNHKTRVLPTVKINNQQARKIVNPNLKIQAHRLALIESKRDGQEILCHEFTVRFENATYMIYVNALTGDEEEVVKMDTEETGM